MNLFPVRQDGRHMWVDLFKGAVARDFPGQIHTGTDFQKIFAEAKSGSQRFQIPAAVGNANVARSVLR
jgi:hypothetical protein